MDPPKLTPKQAKFVQEYLTPGSLPPSSSSRAGCPYPATHPVRALRCEPAACRRHPALADPRRGQQRAGWQQGGRGWADAVGGKGRLIFLSPDLFAKYGSLKSLLFAPVKDK
jgi:hypothetical protein